MPNDRNFLIATLSLLADAGIQAWVNGGWAEELWGLVAPRPHGDVDLLYPAPDFSHLDGFLKTSPGLEEILAKHFSHKRAFLFNQVMVEMILAQKVAGREQTNFFSGRCCLVWPENTFTGQTLCLGVAIPTVSIEALAHYRKCHLAIEAAYRADQQR